MNPILLWNCEEPTSNPETVDDWEAMRRLKRDAVEAIWPKVAQIEFDNLMPLGNVLL